MPPDWEMVASEYPPTFGGVADYSATLSHAMADAGASVRVWTVGPEGADADDRPGLEVRRLGPSWSPAAFDRLSAGLAGDGPRTVLVQYTPNSFGAKGVNLGLVRWLRRRARRGDDVRVMFHELWYHPLPGDGLRRRALALAQRAVTRAVFHACRIAYVSTPLWGELLGDGTPVWLPVPSNIPVDVDDPAVAAIRRGLDGSVVVGHFGTFARQPAEVLSKALPAVLGAEPSAVALLIGPGGEAFAARMIAESPGLKGRVVATGSLGRVEVSHHLQAADVLLQPYPDGACARRTTLMAALEHGKAVVTTYGAMTEPVWRETGCLSAAADDRPDLLPGLVCSLLHDPAERDRLGALASRTYHDHFEVGRTVDVLLGRVAAVAGQGGAS